jgi:DNA polymerase I
MKKPTLLLLDGNALLHRSWHAIPPLTTKDGLVVNAAYGFAMVIEKMLERHKPDYMAVAWDLPGGTFRNEISEDYKANRETKEQELYDQIDLIQEILDGFGIPSIDAEGFEADDVIGTLSLKGAQKGMDVMIVTGDLDALQLVDKNVHVLFFIKGIGETRTYDEEAVFERYTLQPDQLIDYKALRGDPSDNIPGVAGVGDKTATLLLREHKTLDGVYKALKDGKIVEKFAKKLRGQEEVAEQSQLLATIVRDVKTGFRFPSAKMKDPDWKTLLEIYRNLEFRSLLRKHQIPMADVPAPKRQQKAKDTVEILKNTEDLSKKLSRFEDKTVGLILAEQQADLFGGTIAAIALSDGKQTLVIPNPKQETFDEVGAALQKATRVVVPDLKALMHSTGWKINVPVFDVTIASYLLHSGSRAHDLHSAINKQLGTSAPELPLHYNKDKDYKKLAALVALMPKLEDVMHRNLKDAELCGVFDGIEIPLVPVIVEMEKAGIELDSKGLDVLSKKLEKKLQTISKKIHKFSGDEININSPSQLAEVLFEKLELPTKGIKKTKTGYSTAASELEKLWEEHEIIPLISEYRELAKLQSTYVEALPRLVEKDARIHTSFNQTVTATGRLSSSEPNLQNIPIKTELGREIRKAFIAPKGKTLIAADYSQVELRLMAVIAEDKPFIEAFQSGADIHTRTASEVWEIPEEEITKDQRRAAKAINFGIMYGMGARALARSTGLTQQDAKLFIEKYFEVHGAVKKYLDDTKDLARQQGFVETLFGRRRYLPEIETGIPMLIAQAERMAINMPIQGTAADLMKKAMLATSGWLKASGLPATVLLQVHDELVLEADEGLVDDIARGLKEMMEGVAEFKVPLKVDVEVGENWGEMEAWEK